MFRPMVVPFQAPLRRADLQVIRGIERQDSEVVGARIGHEGQVQVRTLSGEMYDLPSSNTRPDRFTARRLAHTLPDHPLPPAGAAALRAA